MNQMSIVILGLSITSSWGNGHAVTYRSLVNGLVSRGHRIVFLERDRPWYAQNRDFLHGGVNPQVCIYHDIGSLVTEYASRVRDADLVIVGSYVPDGIRVGEWVTKTAKGVTAFYDIDTPITLARIERSLCEYIIPELIRKYDLYLSFSGGPILNSLETRYGSPAARALYCSVDPEVYRPQRHDVLWDLGYLGTYSMDRQPKLDELLTEPARHLKSGRFIVAGPQYPHYLEWPKNITRIDDVPPAEHSRFYNSQRLTLNITRADMVHAGWSPSVRLFEAAACGTPIISDWWPGLDNFFSPGEEILIASSPHQTIDYLTKLSDEHLTRIASRAREKVLLSHTASARAEQLERYVLDAKKWNSRSIAK